MVSWHDWYEDYTVPSPFCHGNYVDGSVFLGRVWHVALSHTQLLKEMSSGLSGRW